MSGWLVLTLLWSYQVVADPSSAILLRREQAEDAVESSTASGRYRVTPNPNQVEEEIQPSQQSVPQEIITDDELRDAFINGGDEQFLSEPVKKTPKPKGKPKKKVAEQPKPNEPKPQVAAEMDQPANEDPKSISQEIQDVLLGGGFFEMLEYKMRLGENDMRKNQLEIALSPAVMYNDSTTGYSYHKYTNFMPGFTVNLDMWITPFFGLYANYTGSTNGSVKQLTADPVTAEHRLMDYGVEFRRFFSQSAVAPSLTFKIKSQDYEYKVDADATERIGFADRGIGLGLEARIPTSPRYQQVYYLDWVPNVDHKETTTQLNLKSGTSVNSTRMGIGVGGEFIYSRTSVLFWYLKQSYQKNTFKGPANLNDPQTGSKPNNVSVDNSLLMFTFGYRWGN